MVERFKFNKNSSIKCNEKPYLTVLAPKEKHNFDQQRTPLQSTKPWNDLKPPTTTYNHLQPPQKFQQRPITTLKTSTATLKLSKPI